MVLKRVQSLCGTSYGIPIQILCFYGLANAKGDTSQLKLVREKVVPHILTLTFFLPLLCNGQL